MNLIEIKITVETKDNDGVALKAVRIFRAPKDKKPEIDEKTSAHVSNLVVGMLKPFLDGWYGTEEKKS